MTPPVNSSPIRLLFVTTPLGWIRRVVLIHNRIRCCVVSRFIPYPSFLCPTCVLPIRNWTGRQRLPVLHRAYHLQICRPLAIRMRGSAIYARLPSPPLPIKPPSFSQFISFFPSRSVAVSPRLSSPVTTPFTTFCSKVSI